VPHVFVSYVSEDQSLVLDLSKALRDSGVDVWLDREKLRPGQRWKSAIRSAIREGGHFLACFSNAYLRRDRTFMNEELRLAVELLRLQPHSREWFIPVLLSECEIPDIEIGPGESIRDFQWVDLSDGNASELQRMITALGGAQEAPRKKEATAAEFVKPFLENRPHKLLQKVASEIQEVMSLRPQKDSVLFSEISAIIKDEIESLRKEVLSGQEQREKLTEDSIASGRSDDPTTMFNIIVLAAFEKGEAEAIKVLERCLRVLRLMADQEPDEALAKTLELLCSLDEETGEVQSNPAPVEDL